MNNTQHKKNHVIIIGCGFSGLSTAKQLLESTDHIYISIIEKNECGPGLAYSSTSTNSLVNSYSNAMGLSPHQKDHFHQWLSCDMATNENASNISHHPPRALYGKYLKNQFSNLLNFFGKRVSIIKAHVTSIVKIEKMIEVQTTKAGSFRCDYVIIATGGWRTDILDKFESHVLPVYPESKLRNYLMHAEHVIIYGTKLSAIDATLFVSNVCKAKEITLVSTSAFLPSVKLKNPIDDYINQVIPNSFSNEGFDNNANLSVLLDLCQMELQTLDATFDLDTHLFPQGHTYQYLLRDILNAQKEFFKWQAPLTNINKNINYLYNKLTLFEKKKFITNYFSQIARFTSAIPLINAKKVAHLLRKKTLKIVKACEKNIHYRNNQFELSTPTHQLTSQYVIDATGITFKLNKHAPSFIQKGLKEGLFSTDWHQGIKVDFDSNKIINAQGEIENNIFAIGPLTGGVFLVTNSTEFLAEHANRITRLIKDGVKQ